LTAGRRFCMIRKERMYCLGNGRKRKAGSHDPRSRAFSRPARSPLRAGPKGCQVCTGRARTPPRRFPRSGLRSQVRQTKPICGARLPPPPSRGQACFAPGNDKGGCGRSCQTKPICGGRRAKQSQFPKSTDSPRRRGDHGEGRKSFDAKRFGFILCGLGVSAVDNPAAGAGAGIWETGCVKRTQFPAFWAQE